MLSLKRLPISNTPKTRVFMTIRLRLTLLYSTLLMVIVIIFSGTVFAILGSTMRRQTDETLTNILDEVEQDMDGFVFEEADGKPMMFTPLYPQLRSFRTPGVYVQLWRADEPNYPISLSANITLNNAPLDAEALDEDKEVRKDVTLEDSHLRVITRPLKTERGYTVAHMQAAMSLDTMDEAREQLKKIMVLGSGIALLISVILGDWLARRALRPIANITRTADHIIVAEDLNSRIPYDGPMDEIGSLITTLNQMISRLEKSFNSQQRFVGDVSHELRTPLTAIQSHVDLIERYGLTGEDDKSLKFVKSEVRRMSRLVGDLLTLAQADMGQLPVIETEVQLDTLLLNMYSQAKILSQDKVKITLGDFDQILVRGDEDRLQQLLLNLVTNALKFTPEGGTIKLSLRQTTTHAEIEVKDTGIGIPPNELPHIFDRFYRVDKARARAMGGAGLGLSIAKWIADIHQGELRVESVVGEGTTFTLALPLHPELIAEDGNNKDSKQRFSALRLKKSEVH